MNKRRRNLIRLIFFYDLLIQLELWWIICCVIYQQLALYKPKTDKFGHVLKIKTENFEKFCCTTFSLELNLLLIFCDVTLVSFYCASHNFYMFCIRIYDLNCQWSLKAFSTTNWIISIRVAKWINGLSFRWKLFIVVFCSISRIFKWHEL